MDERLQELRQLEVQEKARRVETAAQKIQEIFKEYEVEFQYLAKAPNGGTVMLKDLLQPGWGFIANLVPKDPYHE